MNELKPIDLITEEERLDVLSKWLTRMKSGTVNQGKWGMAKILQGSNDICYSPMGILADTLVERGYLARDIHRNGHIDFVDALKEKHVNTLPVNILIALGLNFHAQQTADTYVMDLQEAIMQLNDEHEYDFGDSADFIEQNLRVQNLIPTGESK